MEQNKAIVRRFLEVVVNQKNVCLLDDLVASDYVDHTHQLRGLEDNKQLHISAFRAFPDWRETIEDIIAEGDKVWVRVKTVGTHTGEWRGLAPTGKTVTTKKVGIFRIANGKLVEGWFVTEALHFLKHLGAIEYTERGKKLFPEDAK